MKIKGALPSEIAEPVADVLAARGMSEAHVVGLSSGAQSTCFIIEGRPGNEKVVLKAMSPARPNNTPDSVEREYRALEAFYEVSKENTNFGAPEPLALFNEQRGYLMAYVDGTRVSDLLKAGSLGEEDMGVIARRIVCALELYQQNVGAMYGDFHPANVLVRPSLQVTLIDPTPTSPFQASCGNGDRYSLASADIGYWAYSVAAKSVKQSLKGSRLSARLFRLTSEVIAYAGAMSPDSDAGAFYEAVYEVAESYILRLKARGGLKVRVLAPLAERRLKALRVQSQNTAARYQSVTRRGVARTQGCSDYAASNGTPLPKSSSQDAVKGVKTVLSC